MRRILPLIAVGVLLVAIAGSRAQAPVKDPTGLTDRIKEMVKDLADKEIQLRLPALREQIRKEMLADEKERRKREEDLTKKFETELTRLRGELAKATAEAAKASLDQERRKIEAEVTKKVEAETAKLRADLAKANAELGLHKTEAEQAKKFETESAKLRGELGKMSIEQERQKTEADLTKKFEQERRKFETDLAKKFEVDAAKLRTDLAKANADLLKANLELAKLQATAGNVPGMPGAGRPGAVALPKGSFRIGGMVVSEKGKGRVAIDQGKDKVRTYGVGDVFTADGVKYRVESVGREGAVLVVEQRVIAN